MKPASSKDIAAIYSRACTQGLSFAAFRLPGSKKIEHIIGTASRHLKKDERAFTFAPFDREENPYYIKEEINPSKEETIVSAKPSGKQKSTSKKQYTDLVKSIITKIKSGKFKKIVAARIVAIDKPVAFDPMALFEKLCIQSPAAFVSMTYIPDAGLWIGASPEVLVAETSDALITYSLAGTKSFNDRSDWSTKEINEQKIVTDFIYKKLHKTVNEKISIKGPVTHSAGTIKHLLSVFSIRHEDKSIWKEVAKALHPTPAVAGMPRAKALQFISKQESFDRSFYAGYLGPVNYNDKTELFVNLRCMQVTDRQLFFYAGCGVTADSGPDQEWLESERKIAVLKSLI